jgi:hypothetical protein
VGGGGGGGGGSGGARRRGGRAPAGGPPPPRPRARGRLNKSMSHSIFLVTKFGFIPVDTYTLKLTGTGPQKIPHYPSESHYMFNFTCNVLSVQQGSLEPFFSDTISLHLYITHADTTFNIRQITGNMRLIQEDCAPSHTTKHFQHHLY